MNNQNSQNIINEIKNPIDSIHTSIINILKDTIKDCNTQNRRLFNLAKIELGIITITIIVSIYFIYRQNIKYQEFLSQFDFETEIIQVTDNYSTINSGINLNK